MGLGAVLIVGAKNQEFIPESGGCAELADAGREPFLEGPLECVEVVGRSLLERLIERFAAIDVKRISVLVEGAPSQPIPRFRAVHGNVTVRVVSDPHAAIAEELADYTQKGIAHSFMNWADCYAETDLLDLFCFHRESRQPVTRTFDGEGLLKLSVVDCAKAQRSDLENLLEGEVRGEVPKYFIREYVTRLTHPRELRRMAADILRRSCETGPSGRQVTPGVWIDDDAEVHRRARIVAPAYIGCGSKIRADALITRFTDVERDCCIDSGTVIEDSSILANTSIGICLDLCHAVASGNKLWNLERDVAIDIFDSSLMRFTTAVRKPVASSSERIEARKHTGDLGTTLEMPASWQLDNNLIRE